MKIRKIVTEQTVQAAFRSDLKKIKKTNKPITVDGK
jgi:hypothetical protein